MFNSKRKLKDQIKVLTQRIDELTRSNESLHEILDSKETTIMEMNRRLELITKSNEKLISDNTRITNNLIEYLKLYGNELYNKLPYFKMITKGANIINYEPREFIREEFIIPEIRVYKQGR